MDNRFTIIKDLVIQTCERLRKEGISVDANTIDGIVNKFYSSGSSIDQVRGEVSKLEHIFRLKQAILNEGLDVARNLQSLSVPHKGITIHNQDIDLMMIACSNDFYELQVAMQKVSNISLPPIMADEGFADYRQRVFDAYLDSLTSRDDYIRNNDIELLRKLEHLGKSGILTIEEFATVQQIISANKDASHTELVKAFTEVFGEEKTHDMIEAIWAFKPIEKDGVKSSSLEAYRALDKQVRYFYDSLTIDEECKYGNVMLQDGTFEDKRLRKTLDYARSMGKTVRMNTIMFYMDCPEEIYELKQDGTSKAIAREKLEKYVDSVTRVMADYPDVVRSVDVFNELLNRFPLDGTVPYMVRGDIPQPADILRGLEGLTEEEKKAELEKYLATNGGLDNIKSGWLRHFTVEDLCEILQIARKNLPDMDFMYNDDNLTDPKKLAATVELIKRIQDYSSQLGLSGEKGLITSIGTQMHIDNNVSKEDIRNMFLELGKLELPIEITEFDLAMTSGMEGKTPEQIEVLRQKKLNEVFEVIQELKDECRIRGIIIWSKTDSQNFRVTLANEIAHKSGSKFISTLHGGFFTESMVPKSTEMSMLIRKQNFNYHGHTSRCGHAANMDDFLYVLAARNQGLSRIGFSDHVALSPLENWQQGQRMHISEVDSYIASIRELQAANSDMKIRCGFEAEYDPMKKGYLAELRKKCDYMILGQHYVQNGTGLESKTSPNYPLVYAAMVCEAMETGIFDIVAHPDCFLEARDKCKSDEEYALFMKNAREASMLICKTAQKMGIPLELNVGSAVESKEYRDGEFGAPHSLFWEIAAEVGNDVIYGVDAHHPGQIMSIDEDRELVESKIDTSKLKFVSDEYDPVEARKENLELQEAYDESLEVGLTHETGFIQMIISRSDVGEGDDPYERIGEGLSYARNKFTVDSSAKLSEIDEKLEAIERDVTLTEEQKQVLCDKYALRKERIIETCEAREKAVDRAQVSLNEARELGCETKEEFVQVVGCLTEVKTSSDPVSIERANGSIDEFRESKETTKTATASIDEKPKTLVYKPADTGSNGDGSSSSDGGFSSGLNLLLVIGMLVLFGVIAYFMIR